MSKGASGKSAGLALLVIGLAIGAGLVFTLNYTFDVLTPKTITTTWVETSFVTLTIPATTNSTSSHAQIEAILTSCQRSGSQEYCEIALTNSGSLVTATSGNCSLTFGGQLHEGYTGPSLATATAPGAPQQLMPEATRSTFCQASNGPAAGAGTQVTGTILLADGDELGFAGTAS